MPIKTPQSQLQEIADRRWSKADATSPFGKEVGRATIHQSALAGIGFVESQLPPDPKTGLTQDVHRHLVRIACEHWAPDAGRTRDCRFGCAP